MVDIPKSKLKEIADKIRDTINNIEIMVADEKIDEDTAEEIKDQLKEISELLGTA